MSTACQATLHCSYQSSLMALKPFELNLCISLIWKCIKGKTKSIQQNLEKHSQFKRIYAWHIASFSKL